MAAGGVPLGTLQAWMGHEKIDTTMIYAHYAPTAREAAQIGAIFDAAAVDELHEAAPSPQALLDRRSSTGPEPALLDRI